MYLSTLSGLQGAGGSETVGSAGSLLRYRSGAVAVWAGPGRGTGAGRDAGGSGWGLLGVRAHPAPLLRRSVSGCRDRRGRPAPPVHSQDELCEGLGTGLPEAEHQGDAVLD